MALLGKPDQSSMEGPTTFYAPGFGHTKSGLSNSNPASA